jgi:hypothetical protein
MEPRIYFMSSRGEQHGQKGRENHGWEEELKEKQ